MKLKDEVFIQDGVRIRSWSVTEESTAERKWKRICILLLVLVVIMAVYIMKIKQENIQAIMEELPQETNAANSAIVYETEFDGTALNQGIDAYGIRVLSFGGQSFGPYITLPKGEYTLSVSGRGLDQCVFRITSESGAFNLPWVVSDVSSERIYVEFSLDEEAQNVECFIENIANTPLIIKSIVFGIK